MSKFETYIILLNIRSAENVGSIFRTADALGISKIFCVGITPTPTDRFGREQTKINKVALGAEKSVEWAHRDDIKKLIDEFRLEDIEVIAIEQSESSTDYKKYKVEKDTAFLFGPEVDGLDSETLNLCEKVVEIPMRGKKESLNVSVTVGVALSRILNL